ncbi:30S ribosomal protein S4e [Candidatus Woesearchaeota archaeon]|jgi:small subunit ribosomal protein S4e|nr:30S ribosomal protein S4e [Candidatus Woesearchaeota archaeon]MBT7238067.1 30S ribosomal protein S4e [Candidatus Woesearchaeota archaeon]
MGKGQHIKRLAAPKSWPINRKTNVWVLRSNPGSHTFETSMPAGLILKEILGYVKTTKETKYIVNQGKVSVNGKIVKKQKLPVGILDVITIGKDNYRIIINTKGKLIPVKIKNDEAKLILKRVENKTSLKNKKIQVNFSEGSNMISKEKYNTGDTVVFSDNKVKEHIKLEKGSMGYILAGKQVGRIGLIKEIIEKKGLQPAKIIFTQGKEDFETLRNYVFIVGKNKPLVTLEK